MSNSRNVLEPGLSRYLDGLRFGAAFVVLLSHWAYTRFTDGTYAIIREWNLGSDAVVLFFVLSGFVITFAAMEKDGAPGRFAFSRLSRLWSVAIPALVLTLICDLVGMKINPDFYLDTPFYEAVSSFDYWVRGLTFSTHWGGDITRLGSNGPYWSLSYEAAYYIAFGIMIYMRGVGRIAALLLCSLIFGLKILLLAPAWFMGVGLYLLLRRVDFSRIDMGLAWVMMGLPIVLYIAFQSIGLANMLQNFTYHLMGPDRFFRLGFSDEFIWNAALGILFSIHIFGAARLLAARGDKPIGGAWIKWLAGGSFSLYLVHYPVLQFLGATLPQTNYRLLDHMILLGLTLIPCYIFAALFERSLPKLRRVLKGLLPTPSPAKV